MKKQKFSKAEISELVMYKLTEGADFIVEKLLEINEKYQISEDDNQTLSAVLAFVFFCYDFSFFSVYQDSQESIDIRAQIKENMLKFPMISQEKLEWYVRNHGHLLRKHKNHTNSDWIVELVSVTFNWRDDNVSGLFLLVFLQTYEFVEEISKKIKIVLR